MTVKFQFNNMLECDRVTVINTRYTDNPNKIKQSQNNT